VEGEDARIYSLPADPPHYEIGQFVTLTQNELYGVRIAFPTLLTAIPPEVSDPPNAADSDAIPWPVFSDLETFLSSQRKTLLTPGLADLPLHFTALFVSFR
jgi:hypothetical protein